MTAGGVGRCTPCRVVWAHCAQTVFISGAHHDMFLRASQDWMVHEGPQTRFLTLGVLSRIFHGSSRILGDGRCFKFLSRRSRRMKSTVEMQHARNPHRNSLEELKEDSVLQKPWGPRLQRIHGFALRRRLRAAQNLPVFWFIVQFTSFGTRRKEFQSYTQAHRCRYDAT